MQALEYEEADGSTDLSEFFDSVRGNLRTDMGRAWAAEIEQRRTPRTGTNPPP